MTDSFCYPPVEDILDIHEDIVSEYPDTIVATESHCTYDRTMAVRSVCKPFQLLFQSESIVE